MVIPLFCVYLPCAFIINLPMFFQISVFPNLVRPILRSQKSIVILHFRCPLRSRSFPLSMRSLRFSAWKTTGVTHILADAYSFIRRVCIPETSSWRVYWGGELSAAPYFRLHNRRETLLLHNCPLVARNWTFNQWIPLCLSWINFQKKCTISIHILFCY